MAANQINPKRLSALAALLAILLLSAGCGPKRIDFPYAREELTFPQALHEIPGIYISPPLDLRPDIQKTGAGHLLDVHFPADVNLTHPVSDVYAAALTADLTQTMIAVPAALPSHADYILNAEIYAFGCRFQRNPSTFILPLGAGMMGGFFMSDDTSGRLKRGAVFSVMALGALPVPAKVSALVEVKLILRDAGGETVWERTCVGEIEDSLGEAALSRRDKALAERYIPQALKRCNACLLGQLRQFLITR